MGFEYSLAHLTMIECPPPELVHIAARAGYDYVSLRLIPMGNPGERAYLPEDKPLIRETKAALMTTGVGVLDIELARIVHDRDPKSYESAMAMGAELGARHVIASAWTQERDDREFIVDRYAEICDLARPYGLTVELEFPTFSRLRDLQEAADIVRAADAPNGGVLIDTLYYLFSRVTPAELEALPREWIHMLHICDAGPAIPETREGMIHVAREDRLYPGHGCIDFWEITSRLPIVPMSIELPNAERLRGLGYEGHARRCLEAAKHCLDYGSFLGMGGQENDANMSMGRVAR